MSFRLDAEIARRGLARSRSHAAALIADGAVHVDGRPVTKASAKVTDDSAIEITAADHYVSRGAHKLLAALDAFDLSPTGRPGLDLGASTGGFTQVLLERGATQVVALDVGHDQLAESLRADPRVRVVEGFNVRDLTPDTLAGAAGHPLIPGIITGDLSFISLSLILPAVASVSADADIILLVKPQFEVGRTGIREGVVRDPAKRVDAVSNVLWSAWDAGLATHGLIASPIAGGHGNREYLLWLRVRAPGSDAGNPSQWLGTVEELAGSA